MTDDDLSPARFGEVFSNFLRAVVENAPKRGPILRDRLQAHLQTESTTLPVFTETFDRHDHPNVQVALNAWADEGDDRETQTIGVSGQHKEHVSGLISAAIGNDDFSGFPPLTEGAIDYANYRLANDEVLPCVQFGLLLLSDGGHRLAVSVLGPSGQHGPREKVLVEVVSLDPATGQAFIGELRTLMSRLNVYRGHVISLSPGRMHMGPQTLVAFHDLPAIQRDNVILPEELLERIERHTFVFAEHADRLRAAGRSLKRGMLLYGPPGTGKTLTLMYLIGRMEGRTVLLTTGLGMGLLDPVMQMARSLAPSMVILEDVDLIAEERGMPHSSGGLLFELLNQLDGLEDDADLIFALTTNRPEILEPALAARPGRVDLAVELPLPDAEARRKLFELYGQGLELIDVDLVSFAEQTDGASPAYIKELLRRAAVLAAVEGGELKVTSAHLSQAIEELSEGGRLARRILGFQHPDQGSEFPIEPGFPGPHGAPWMG